MFISFLLAHRFSRMRPNRAARAGALAGRLTATDSHNLEPRLLYSSAPPVSLAGSAYHFFGTGGAGGNLPPVDEFIGFTASRYSGSSWETNDDISGAITTYTITGPNTATLTDAENGAVVQFTFDTPNTGTVHESDPDGSFSGIFVRDDQTTTNLPPDPLTLYSLNGYTLYLNIQGGAGDLATSGNIRMTFANNQSQLQTNGGAPVTGGLFNPDAKSPGSVLAGYSDNSTHAGQIALAFATPSTGYFYISEGFQYGSAYQMGTFSLVDPALHQSHDAYIRHLYPDLFNRSADPSGEAFWTDQLDSGQTMSQVATALTSSREYDGDLVDAIYVRYLGRHAETGGLNSWIDQMQAGLNAEVIRAGILGSDEYFNRTGPNLANGTVQTFFTELYHSFLNREPEPNGFNSWVNALNDGQITRSQAAAGFANSDENRTDIVTGFYETYLHRMPDDDGLAVWKQNLADGISQPAIISFFVTSPEYLAHVSP